MAKEYPSNHIFAADETAVCFDNPRGTSLEIRGSREVAVKSCGSEKKSFTVMLTASADGRKLPPYLLLERKRVVPGLAKFSKVLVIEYGCSSGWMDDSTTAAYLQKVLGNKPFWGNQNRLLVWDSFRAHISQSTKEILKKLSVDTAVVPGGCTKFVQAPDVYWNASFKAKINDYYDAWLADGEKTFTAGGNMRPPALEVVCQWIVDSWAAIPKEVKRFS